MAQYRDIAEHLRGRLAAREWPLGGRLPGIGTLMVQYGVTSLNTIRQAEQLLAADGILRSEPGKGVYVVAIPDPPDADKQALLAKVRGARRMLVELSRVLAGIEATLTLSREPDPVRPPGQGEPVV
jgi:DNA-binding GntR family transcriptional regulator